jgi:hypothetical protein
MGGSVRRAGLPAGWGRGMGARSGAAGALVIMLAAAGCGTVAGAPAGHPAQAGSPPAPATASQAAGSSAAAQPAAAQPAAAQPAGGPVPAGFAATSVTFVSPEESFVLGTAPCATPPCTSIVRTLDRGAHWRGLPAPVVPVGSLYQGSSTAVWGIRFATPAHGFVFGHGLWETTDGGLHWARDPQPRNAILSLAVLGSHVLALTGRCTPQGGCGQSATLLRRPLAGGAWATVATVHLAGSTDPTDLISTQAGDAAVLDGTRVLTITNGGMVTSVHPTPCTRQGVAFPASVAATSGHGDLALLCVGQAAMSHTGKQVYVSGNGGATWAKAGVPDSAGDGGTIAGPTPVTMVVATASAASWLYRSASSAASWHTVKFETDGGMGWADLGFTTFTQGVVVHGPAITDGNRDHRPGQLLLTTDSGATWHPVHF